MDASSISQLFSDEMPDYTYRIKGENKYIIDFPSPDKVVDDPTYTNGNVNMVSVKTYTGAVLMNHSTTGICEMDIMNGYIVWNETPVLISMCYTPGTENVKDLMDYIISSMAEESVVLDSQEGYDIGNYTFTLPSGFTKVGSSLRGNALSPLSGISIGVFRYSENLNEATLTYNLGGMVHETTGISGTLVPAIYAIDKEISISGRTPRIYEGSTSYICDEKNGESYYGLAGNLFYIIYSFSLDDKTEVILLTYEPGQEALAKHIASMIEALTEIK